MNNFEMNFRHNCMHAKTITLDCDATPVLQIKAHRLKAGRLETSHYKVTISRFRARLSTRMNYNTLKGEAVIEGYPDVSAGSRLVRRERASNDLWCR